MLKWALPLGLLAVGIAVSHRPTAKSPKRVTRFLMLPEVAASSSLPIELHSNEKLSVELPTILEGEEVFYLYSQKLFETDTALNIVPATPNRFLILPKGPPMGGNYIITFEAFNTDGELVQEADLHIAYF